MAWSDVTFHRVEVRGQKIDRLLDTMRETHSNGGVVFACFEADDPAALQREMNKFLGGPHRWAIAFLESETVRDSLPELRIKTPLNPKPEFKHSSALATEGELTHTILCGGAYDRFRGDVDDAREISRGFMEEIVHGSWLETRVSISYTPWTEWFYDVAWDATFVLRGRNRLWLLCITDTD